MQLLSASTLQAQGDFGSIDVQAPATVLAEEPFTVRAGLLGTRDVRGVRLAELWYRDNPNGSFAVVEMILRRDSFFGTIPADEVTVPYLDFYVTFTFMDGSELSYPVTDPDLNPIQVTVQSTASSDRRSGAQSLQIEQEPSVIILSPRQKSIVNMEELLVAVSFDTSQIVVIPRNIRLRIDRFNYTHRARISRQTLTAIIKDLEPGEHLIEIEEYNGNSYRTLASWKFYFQERKGSGEEQISSEMTGQFYAEESYQKINATYKNINAAGGGIFSRQGNVEASFQGRITSEERPGLQPQNRYLIGFQLENYRFQIGDIFPRYNELMLWGRRVRGMEHRYKHGNFSITGLYGQLNRKVSSDLINVTSYIDSTGITPVIVADSTFASGTYTRNMWSLRSGINRPRHYRAELTLMKVFDDKESISHGPKPKDNLLTGIHLEYYFDEGRLGVMSQTSISLYNHDTSTPPLEGLSGMKSFIWINQFFEPLPDDTTGDLGPIVSAVASKALANVTRVRANYFNNTLDVGFRKVGASYYSLGLTTLINDRQGFFVNDRIRLFKDFNANIGYQSLRDNLNGTEKATTTYNDIFFGFNVFSSVNYPTLSANYRIRLVGNNGERNLFIGDDGNGVMDTTITDTRKDIQSNYYSLNLSQNFYFNNTNNDITASFTSSGRTDAFQPVGNSDYTATSLILRTLYSNALETRLTATLGRQSGAISEIDYNTFSFRMQRGYFNRGLQVYFGPQVTLGSGNNQISPITPEELLTQAGKDINDPANQVELDSLRLVTAKNLLIDFRKYDWVGGFDWNFKEHHTIRLYSSFTHYVNLNEFEYFNGATFPATKTLVQNSNGEQSVEFTQSGGSVDRNDVIFMLTYQYQF
ncbi:hypothetical protein K8I28_14810 [bacterium]|nr:hypothetical protein [bacterium]